MGVTLAWQTVSARIFDETADESANDDMPVSANAKTQCEVALAMDEVARRLNPAANMIRSTRSATVRERTMCRA